MIPTPRDKPPGLTQLARAVVAQASKKPTTREQAVRAGKATAPIVISVTAAVAISQLVQGLWQTGTSVSDRIDQRVTEKIASHNDSASAHRAEIDKLREQLNWCRFSVENLERQGRELRALLENTRPLRRDHRARP